jgi:restriction endonuclease S subunit
MLDISFGTENNSPKSEELARVFSEIQNARNKILESDEKNKIMGYTSSFVSVLLKKLLDGENIFISNTSPLGLIQYYNGKCNYSDLLCHIKLNDNYKNKINIKYIYYFLKSLQKHIEKTYQKGACNLSLDQKNFNRMKIPIPPLEIQTKLVTKLDASNNKVKYMKLIVDSMKQDIETFIEWTIEIENRKSETQWIAFGEVFTLKKGKLQSSKIEEDENGDVKLVLHTLSENDWRNINIDDYYLGGLFIPYNHAPGRQLPITYCDYNIKCINTDLMYRAMPIDSYKNKINLKFYKYFIKNLSNHIKENYYKGSCNLSLDLKNFNRMKIQIPSINQQNKCIEKINEMEEIIKRWENDIDNILNNDSNKFLEYLESESFKYEKNK